MTHVVTILKLTEILRKMLRADMDMRAVNAALQLRPVAFNRVGSGSVVCGELPRVVAHGHVVKAKIIKAAIAAKLVRANGRAGVHMELDHRFHRGAVAARDNFGDNLPATFLHANDNSLVGLIARPLTLYRTADQSFVNLDNPTNAAERITAVNRAHILADFVTHAPSRFVGHAKLALDFLGGDTVSRSAELKHNEKPIAQRRAGAVKRRASGRIDLMGTPLALVGPTTSNARVTRRTVAAGAIKIRPVTRLKQVIEASVLGREAVLKLAKGGGFRAHTYCVPQTLTCRKGISTNLFQDDGLWVALPKGICAARDSQLLIYWAGPVT